MTNIGTLTAKLVMDSSQFNAGLSAAEKQLQSTQNKVALLSAALTGAFVAGIGAAVADTMNFEHSISAVGAISQATASQLDGLRQTAIRVGADTQYSAGEAADAMQDLAANGLSATDIMNGAADATAALAAAGGTDLSLAADTVSTAMAVWGQNTSSLTRDVNELAGAANVSRFGVEDMSLAIAAGGGAASAAGVSFDDFTASIAAVAPYFSSGRTAGTAMKVFLTDLTPTSQAAADAMQQLGIITADGANQFFTASGQMKSLAQISQILHDALGPLSDAQRTQAASTIFGTEAMTTAVALSKQTNSSFQQLEDTMANTSAADVAAQRMNNASGSFEQLRGSVESAAITMGERLQPALKATFDGLTNLTNGFTNLGGADQTAILALTGLAAAAPAVAIGISKIATAWSKPGGLKDFLATGPGKFSAIALGIGAVGVAADAIVAKTSGHGILEWVFGDPKQADQISKIMSDTAAVAKAVGANFDAAGYATEHMNVALESLAANLVSVTQAGRDRGTVIAMQGNATRDATSSVIAYSQQLVDAGTSTQDLIAIHDSLAQKVAETSRATVGLTGNDYLLADAQATAAKAVLDSFDKTIHYNALMDAGRVSADQLTGALQQLPASVDIVSAAQQANATAATAATTATDTFVAEINGAKDRVQALSDAINELTTAYSDMDPTVLSLNAKIAELDVQIAQVKAAGGDTSALEKLRQSYQDQADAAGSYGKALEPLITNLGQLPGAGADTTAMFAALGSQMRSANVPASDAYGVMSKLNTALDQTDASTAIAQLESLKGEMNPSLWAPAAEAIGPELVEKIATGLGDPSEKLKLIQQAQGLGIDVASAIDGTDFMSVGANIIAGIQAGIFSGTASLIASSYQTAAQLTAAWQGAMGINSPSKVMHDKVGMPITQGIAQGILDAMPALDAVVDDASAKIADGFKEHAKTAAEEFSDALTTSIHNTNLAAQFGDEGATIMETFEDALTNPTSAAKLPDLIVKLLQEMQAAGVPNAQALGDALGQAIVDGLNGQASDIAGALNNITSALGTNTALTVANFGTAVTAAIDTANLKDALGSAGSDLMDALNTAIEQGGQDNINTLAGDVAALQSTLNSKAPEGQAAYLGTHIMSALQAAIASNTPAAIAALQSALTQANAVVQGGAVNIQTGTVMTAQAVSDLADSLGVSKDFIINNITTLVSSGLDTLAGKLNELPDSTQKAIQATLKAWDDGKISMTTAVTQLGNELPPAIIAALQAVGDAATPIAQSIGTSIGNALASSATSAAGAVTGQMTGGAVAFSGGVSLGSVNVNASAANAVLDKGKTGVEMLQGVLGYNPLDVTQGYLTDANGRNLTTSDVAQLVQGGTNGITAALASGAVVAHSGPPATEAQALNIIQGGIGGYTDNGDVYSPDGTKLFALSDSATMASTAFPTLPSYDVGTPYVPRDMVAQIHRGEAIIPASQNRGGGAPTFHIDAININGVQDADDVIEQLEKRLPDIFGRYWQHEMALAGVR